MLDGVPFKPIPNINVVLHKGGMGDTVARLPAVRYILKRNKHIQHITLYVQDYFVEAAMQLLHEYADRVTVKGYTGMAEAINASNDPGLMCDSSVHTTLRTHLTDHAFHCLADEGHVSAADKKYLKFAFEGAPLTKKKQVVITTGFTSPTREFNTNAINGIIKWCLSKGIVPVLLGKTESIYQEDKANRKTTAHFSPSIKAEGCLDMREKTTVVEAATIMEQSLAVVGIDNGLLHLAACTSTPIVFGLTTLTPKHRIPYCDNKISIVVPNKKDTPCRYCQSRMHFVYNFSLRTCYTNTYSCISNQKEASFIQAIEEVTGE